MIGALSSLLKIEEFCAHPHNFAIVIMELSNAQKVQIKAMEVLLTIFQQHMTVELFSEVFQAVAANSITSVPSELEDSLHFQRLYAGAIHSLLSQHVSFVTDTSSAFYRLIADPVRQFQAFVRTMIVTVVSSPSIRLPGDVIKEWVKIYRDKNCRNCEVLRDSAMEVLNGEIDHNHYIAQTQILSIYIWDHSLGVPISCVVCCNCLCSLSLYLYLSISLCHSVSVSDSVYMSFEFFS